ncbi:energy transducer TonB [Rhabdaerophilum calidifontis]|uniref:energy transducer TonB n=1 Tax=Rhabdaerophilum calidifontis TaxID=2604328 RepID=UPI00123AEDBA|nr:energy transducer TonB [Rhabdaerophilum calidifontis]
MAGGAVMRTDRQAGRDFSLPEPDRAVGAGYPPTPGRVGLCPAIAGARRLGPGIALSLVLHFGAAAAAIVLLPARPAPETPRGGEAAAIEMAVIGAEERDSAQEGAQPAMTEPDMPEIAPPDAVPPPELVAIAVPPPEPPMPVDMPPPPPVQEPLAPVPVDPVVALPPPAPPRVEPKTEPAPRPAARPQRESRIAPRETRAAPRETRAAPRAADEARGRQGAGQQAVTRQASAAGGSGGAAASAGTAEIASYRSRLVAHLSRYKTYPEAARDRGIGGRNVVTITLRRDGRVANAALAGGSGQSLLDAATLAAVRRAEPFPAVPEGAPAPFTVTIGMRYDLRD